MTKILRTMENELNHSANMLDIVKDEIEEMLETNDTSKLHKILSIITKANDNILDQVDELTTITIKKTA